MHAYARGRAAGRPAGAGIYSCINAKLDIFSLIANSLTLILFPLVNRQVAFLHKSRKNSRGHTVPRRRRPEY